MGDLPSGVCEFEKPAEAKRGPRRHSGRRHRDFLYRERLNAGLELENLDPSRIGTHLGITEHGNAETETEVCQLLINDEEVKY